jgi:deoxyadenosine/deoxycytidine kinase
MPPSSSSSPQPAQAFQPPRTIAIEGPIRVGKSTLSRILADRLHARRVFDPEDNPFLADFYKEKPGSAFRAQMYFLFERHRRITEVLQGDVGVPPGIGFSL